MHKKSEEMMISETKIPIKECTLFFYQNYSSYYPHHKILCTTNKNFSNLYLGLPDQPKELRAFYAQGNNLLFESFKAHYNVLEGLRFEFFFISLVCNSTNNPIVTYMQNCNK